METDERASLWHGLREELRIAKSADNAVIRDAHFEQARSYADRLAESSGSEEPSDAGYYIDCALTDICAESSWGIPF
jgi:hypothetical protein